jgi:hypothetical protein
MLIPSSLDTLSAIYCKCVKQPDSFVTSVANCWTSLYFQSCSVFMRKITLLLLHVAKKLSSNDFWFFRRRLVDAILSPDTNFD